MALYARPKSPYWWGKTKDPNGGPPIYKSSGIRHDATTPALRKENRALADAWFHKLCIELIEQRDKPAVRPTIRVGAYVDWYLANFSVHKASGLNEPSMLKPFKLMFEDRDLASLAKEDLIEYRTVRRRTVEASSVNREVNIIRHLLSEAVPRYLERSPVAKFKKLDERAPRTAVLTVEAERRLLLAMKPADRVIIIAALDTLIRAGNLIDLTWENYSGEYLHVEMSKSGHGYKVPVSARLQAALAPLKRAARGRGYLFPHRRGGKTQQTRTGGLGNMLEYACKRANVPYGRVKNGITFHALRHTGATRMVKRGVSLRDIAEIGGWRSLEMLRRYLHPEAQSLIDAVNSIGADEPAAVISGV